MACEEPVIGVVGERKTDTPLNLFGRVDAYFEGTQSKALLHFYSHPSTVPNPLYDAAIQFMFSRTSRVNAEPEPRMIETGATTTGS